MASAVKPAPGRPHLWAAIAVVVSIAVAGFVLATVVPGRYGLGVVIAAAVAWPALSLVTSLLARDGRHLPDRTDVDGAPDGADAHRSVAVIVRIGTEPVDVARASVLMNKAAGLPMVLTSPVALDPELARIGVPSVIEPDPVVAIERAAALVGTEAVIVLSARSIVDTAALATVTGHLRNGHDWVIGRVESIGRDNVVIDPGQQITSSLRRTARARGAVLWESDAVILRRQLILASPDATNVSGQVQRRSLGSWLRALAATGAHGIEVDERLAWRSQPVDPGTYWPDSVARHRLRIIDALGAVSSGPVTGRLAALGVAAYELSSVPALLWIAAPMWVGAGGVYPFEVAPATIITSITVSMVARWFGLRRATGVPLRPRIDVTAAAYRLPASLGGLLRRRSPRTDRASTSPLTIGALICTVLCGVTLLTLPAAQRPTVTVGITAAMLAMLWYVAVLGLAQSNWSRTAFRLPVSFEATIDGVATSVFNASPGGLAIRPVPATIERDARARTVPIKIRLADGSELPCTATVVARRGHGDAESAGLAVSWTDQGRERWLGQLRRCLSDTPDRELRDESLVPADEPAPQRLADRMLSGLVSVVVIGALAVLAAVVAGVHPSIIRSPSMTPVYGVGDIVISSQVRADSLVVGDVAQVPNAIAAIDQGEMLTHRVIAIDDLDDGTVSITTQGDANANSEETLVRGDQAVGRVWASIPWIGTPLVWIRHEWMWVLLVTVVGAAAVSFIARHGRSGDASWRRGPARSCNAA